MKKFMNFVVLLFLPIQFGFCLGRTVSYNELKQHYFASIESIKTCGNWNGNQQPGNFRVIKAFISGGEMLFVDIVTLGKNEITVHYGFSFDETNNDHLELELDKINCLPDDDNKLTLNVSAKTNQNKLYKFMLKIDGLKKTYRYRLIP